MDGRRLRYFMCVAEEEHFLRAAERLSVAPSALSRQIKTLEEELGCTLFERSPGGTVLTEAGRVFKEEASLLLHAYQNAVLKTQNTYRGAAGSLDVGISDIAGRDLRVCSAIRIFREQYPDVDLRLNFISSYRQIEGLRRGEIDLSLGYLVPNNAQKQERLLIADDVYLLAIPSNHRLASNKQIVVADLDQVRFVTLSQRDNPGLWEVSFGRMMTQGIMPVIVQEANNMVTLLSLVSSGLGLCFVHRSYGLSDLPAVISRPIADMPTNLKLEATWHKDNRSPVLRNFIDVLSVALVDRPTPSSS